MNMVRIYTESSNAAGLTNLEMKKGSMKWAPSYKTQPSRERSQVDSPPFELDNITVVVIVVVMVEVRKSADWAS